TWSRLGAAVQDLADAVAMAREMVVPETVPARREPRERLPLEPREAAERPAVETGPSGERALDVLESLARPGERTPPDGFLTLMADILIGLEDSPPWAARSRRWVEWRAAWKVGGLYHK